MRWSWASSRYTYVTTLGVGIPVPLPDGVTIYRDIPITTTPTTVV